MKINYLYLVPFILALALISCGGEDPPQPEPKPQPEEPVDKTVEVTAIDVPNKEITLLLGQEQKLEYTVKPANASDKTVEITSGDASIVSVTGQTIKALKLGETTLTIKSKSASISTKISITVSPVPATEIILDKSELNMYVGEKETLSAQILPENTSDKTITWTSADPAIASVDQDGKIEAKSLGSTDIVATSADGNVKTTAKITVSEDTEFIDGGITFSEETREGKVVTVMETRISNHLNTPITIIKVEGYANGILVATDLDSFTKVIEANSENQYVNEFYGTPNAGISRSVIAWYTKVYYKLKDTNYSITVRTDGTSTVKLQEGSIGINPDWDGESTVEF